MNERSNDRFESLISAAVVDCVYQTADEFCAVDTSAVPSTPRLYKKVMRNLPGRKRTTVKVILVAALVAAFVALTACACITEIREYFWRVVTEWCGEYYEVAFEQDKSILIDLIETDVFDVPTEIEQKAVLTKLPEGCSMGKETIMAGQVHMNYYSDNNEWVFTFSQSVSLNNTLHVDAENSNMVCVNVNENEALLSEEDLGGKTYYNLVWQEGCYRYSISGTFSSVSELVCIAESLIYEQIE